MIDGAVATTGGPMTSRAPLPLAGIRVVDLTSNIAAPFAGAVLADLGADVVHVEGPRGDDSRRMAPRAGDTSAYWQVVNRNKSVQRLDIRDEAGRATLDAMIEVADVFVTNLRPGKLARLGLDPDSLTARHPRLVHASLSAYGDAGDERDRPGYDAVLQARTGIAEVTGTADGPPVRAGVSVLDVGGGTWLALGVLAALLRRERTGRGGAVATSLFETGVSWVGYHVAAFQISGDASARHGSGHPTFAPYGIFGASDRQVCIGVGGDDLFRRLCTALDTEWMAADPRFAANVDRVANARELRDELERVLAGMTAAEVVRRLDAQGVACDVVQKPEDLMTDPNAAATGVLVPRHVEGFGELRIPGLPLTLDGVRPDGPATGARA
jgi:crotonobetainyl-CoA:carnitine CoA-transferase CaiB-like acyl-CoA transferase